MAKVKKKRLKEITLHFYHPDWRINYFAITHNVLKLLIDSKKLKHYIYHSSGNDWQGNYQNDHRLLIHENKEQVVVDALKKAGWVVRWY